MRSLIALTAVVVAAATLTTVAAPRNGDAAAPQRVRSIQVGPTGHTGPTFKQLAHVRSGIRWHTTRTIYWRKRAGLAQHRFSRFWHRSTSLPYLRWVKHHRSVMRVRAKWLAFHIPLTNDWVTAVRLVQRTWPGTSQWMLDTSSGEGGHGICVWNGGAPCWSSDKGSGAAGWLQFMSGTFYSHLASALAYARARHLPVIPPAARTWFSPLGQAFAGGWGCHYNASAWKPHPGC